MSSAPISSAPAHLSPPQPSGVDVGSITYKNLQGIWISQTVTMMLYDDTRNPIDSSQLRQLDPNTKARLDGIVQSQLSSIVQIHIDRYQIPTDSTITHSNSKYKDNS